MYRKVISLILVLALAAAPLMGGAGTVSAASTEDLESIIAQQFNAYAKSLKPEGASEAVSRLVKHSIKGGGTLNLGPSDKFSAGLLNSGLFKTGFAKVAAVAIHHMLDYHETKIFMSGEMDWYENDFSFHTYARDDNGTSDFADDVIIAPSIKASVSYEQAADTYDEGMVLVVGGSRVGITFRQTAADRDTITYKASIIVYDTFDFSGADYSGDDKDLAETLTWIGKLSSWLMRPFKWTINAEVDIKVPNPCVHQNSDYLWQFDGVADLGAVPSRTGTVNPLVKRNGTYENNVFSKTSYLFEKPVILVPDQPWEIEFTSTGTGTVILAEHTSIWKGHSYLRKYRDYIQFGEYILLNETDEKNTLTQYGINFKEDAGISSKHTHTYLLENRIESDGSNMVWLAIDGAEIGPMNDYYHNFDAQGKTNNWIQGKTLRFSYLGNGSYPLTNVAIDYIRVSEGGSDSAPYDLCKISTKNPTCTEKGKTTYTCSRCGAVFSESIPVVSHDLVTIPGSAPTCTEPGLSDGSKCNSCGQVLLEQAIIDPLGHSFEDGICTACGEVEYVLGDVDLDGDVDVDDVLALLWNVLFPEDYPIEVNADFDSNGTIDVDDVLKLLWYVLFPEDYPLN